MKKYFVVSKLSENMHETPEGYLLCIGVPIARTGSMLYGQGETPLETDKDGIIEITRTSDEVFRPQTIASFEGKPVTISHPTEFVTAENWNNLAKGLVQNVRRGADDQADDLIADLLITDRVAIQLVKNGLREVSCGYEAEYTQTEEGKGIQTNIIGNHVALVDEGRAGSEYAIKDHKGVKMDKDKKTMFQKLLSVVGITQDEAKKLVQDEAASEEKPVEEKADDSKAHDGYDALMKAVKDLNAIVSNMTGPTEAAKDEESEEKSEAKPAADAMEERMKKIEDAVAGILEKMGAKDAAEEEAPVVTDEEGGEEEESMDEDMEEGEESEDEMCTGDAASRAEILAPGLDTKGKTADVKAKALKACYGTKEGKKLIEQLNGGKAPAFDSAEKVEMLFTATSEVLKAQRNRELTKTRQVRDQELVDGTPQDRVMTAEKQNELNKEFYKNQRS